MTRFISCPACRGAGKLELACPTCKGRGSIDDLRAICQHVLDEFSRYLDTDFVQVGTVEDLDGRTVRVGVDYAAVTIGPFALLPEQAEQFSRLFAAAVQEAERQEIERADD